MFGTRPKKHIHPTFATTINGEFNEHELSVLSRLSTIVELDAGTTLITEGTVGQEALIVVSGTATVTRDGETIATVGAGSILGEAALMTGEPRNATVIATEGVEVAALSRRDFSAFLASCPRVERVVKQLVGSRQAA